MRTWRVGREECSDCFGYTTPYCVVSLTLFYLSIYYLFMAQSPFWHINMAHISLGILINSSSSVPVYWLLSASSPAALFAATPPPLAGWWFG